jgi:hypothetical protein
MDNLGKKAKDKVTGFTGIITSKHFYLYGCAQYGVSPQVDKDGKIPDIRYFDEGRLEIIGEGIDPKSVQAEKPGCDFRERP